MDATHYDGNGRFVRFYAIESDIAAACERLEEFGWLCDCTRIDVSISTQYGLLLMQHPWPAAETSEILWLAGIPMAQAREELNAILAKKKRRES